MKSCYFFGCGNRIGHYLHDPGGAVVTKVGPFAWSRLDGVYAPKPARAVMPRPEPQSACRVTLVRGWTILAFWDRSLDTRPASNGAFLAKGTHDFAGMLALAREHFPKIVERVERAAPLHLASEVP